MINYHDVIGSKETSFHDFDITVGGLSITLSLGSYVRDNNILIESEEEAVINIEKPIVDTQYEIWLADEGITVRSKSKDQEYGDLVNPIDRLAWFTALANTEDLTDTEIHFVRVVI